MRNSSGLSIASLIAAAILAVVLLVVHDRGNPQNELELGGIAWVLGLAVFGFQGLVSIMVEGKELHPGRVLPRLTEQLTLSIAILSLALLVLTGFLAYGLTSDWRSRTLGILAGVGCILIALIAISYKEGFVGDEAGFDLREDGVPW